MRKLVSGCVLSIIAAATPLTSAIADPAVNRTPPVNPAPEACSRPLNDNPHLLPYLSYSSDVSGLTGLTSVKSPLKNYLGGQAYTRLLLKFIPCSAARADWRSYEAERRDALDRFFAGKIVSKLLSIKVMLTTPNVTTVTPIATVGRESSRKAGEVWSTEVGNSLWLTPYFRIAQGSTAKVNVSMIATTDYTSSVASGVLNILKRATGLISPSATLLSSLNQDKFNDAANFVDTSINSFFKQSITEQAVEDFDVSQGGRPLGALYLRLPNANDTLANGRIAASNPGEVGIWVLETDTTIASIFEPGITTKVFDPTGLSWPSILNFKLTNDQTIAQALDADPSVKIARDAFLKTRHDDTTQLHAAAAALCQAVSVSSDAFNLTPIDVEVVRWAYSQSIGIDPSSPSYAAITSACNPGLSSNSTADAQAKR